MRAQVQFEAPPPPVLPDFITQHLDPFSGDDDSADIDAATGSILSRIPSQPINIPRAGAADRSRRRRAPGSAGEPQRPLSVRLGPEIQALPRPAGVKAPRLGRARSTGRSCGAPIAPTRKRSSPSGWRHGRPRCAEGRSHRDGSGAGPTGVRSTSRPGSTRSCTPTTSARDEGIAMMCLAEALLRIPDARHRRRTDRRQARRAGLVRQARPLGFGLRQCRDLLAAADRQGDRRRAGPQRQLASGAWPRGRAIGRAGGPHRGARGDEDPRPQFRLRA